MPITPEPVRPIALDEIRAARERIAKIILRTPLVRLELGPDQPEIRLKLENLQPINAYRLRGAANAVSMLPDAERRRGVWTISAGNAGQGVAYAARRAGVPCTVVTIETAPAAKLERMKALGARQEVQAAARALTAQLHPTTPDSPSAAERPAHAFRNVGEDRRSARILKQSVTRSVWR
jgi:threonine dehydratase